MTGGERAESSDCCSKAHLLSVLHPSVSVIPNDIQVADTSH